MQTELFLAGLTFAGLAAGAVYWRLKPRPSDDGIQPEMRPGPKNWRLGNKADGSGEDLQPLHFEDGYALCPNCGSKNFLSGPSGGMSTNAACGDCLHEFNLGMFDCPPLILERRGRMTVDRASVYGISPEKYDAKTR